MRPGDRRATVQRLRAACAVAVLRGQDADAVYDVALSVLEGGVRALEVTMTVPGAPGLIRRLVSETEAIVGAGSVRTARDVDRCVDAGACFIVSPACIPEIVERGPSPRAVRVAGTIVAGSIEWEPRELRLQFQISDEHTTAHAKPLQAVYYGPRPDMFRDGADVVLEGTYTSVGIFEARTMLLQCPSKYEEAP